MSYVTCYRKCLHFKRVTDDEIKLNIKKWLLNIVHFFMNSNHFCTPSFNKLKRHGPSKQVNAIDRNWTNIFCLNFSRIVRNVTWCTVSVAGGRGPVLGSCACARGPMIMPRSLPIADTRSIFNRSTIHFICMLYLHCSVLGISLDYERVLFL